MHQRVRSASQPSERTNLLCEHLTDKNVTYFIVIDGLDECAPNEVRQVVSNMTKLLTQSTKCVKVMYTGQSRLEEYLSLAEGSPVYKLPLTKTAVTPDINAYIAKELGQCLEENRLRLTDETLIVEIRKTLETEADGM